MDWVLYDRDLRHERVKKSLIRDYPGFKIIVKLKYINFTKKAKTDHLTFNIPVNIYLF